MPLRVGERCVGVLNVNRINHPDKFQSHHRDVLQLFAEHVGAVIDRAEVMDRMGSRARQLEADNLKLSEMNRLKDIFLSTATHELKTPLTSVIAYAELLDENEKALDAEQRHEFLKRLRGEAARLLALIDEILDLSRLESGKLSLHRVPISINDVAKAAAETSRPLATRRTIEIEEIYDATLPPLPLDEVKMRQVLVNLLVNAIKFSPDNTRITLQTMQEDQYLRVEVRDQGEGIDPDDIASIFELFGQGERARQREEGLGIGLHIVKRVTELHGGHVGVNSTQGIGSNFWVRLPLALASARAVEDDPPAQLRAA
jgi:Amt family ammonium transporter